MGHHPNAQLVLNSRDRNRLQIQGNTATYLNQSYSKFNLQNPGQNILQGDIDKIQVAEVYFPYDIPNIFPGSTDSFWIVADPGSPGTPTVVKVEIAGPVFLTGEELAVGLTVETATALNTAIPGLPAANLPVFTWDGKSGRFYFALTANTATYTMTAYPVNPTQWTTTGPTITQNIPKTLMSLLGFSPFSLGSGGPYPVPLACRSAVVGGNIVGTTGNPAQLAYTTFIDICSTNLCGNTYIRDGSSIPPGGSFRKDLLCRVYIANETSNNEYILNAAGDQEANVPGIRPFVIHRQFKNPKLIKSNLKNSIGNVDITLFDDCGNVIPFGESLDAGFYPRDFQLTLNVYETECNET